MEGDGGAGWDTSASTPGPRHGSPSTGSPQLSSTEKPWAPAAYCVYSNLWLRGVRVGGATARLSLRVNGYTDSLNSYLLSRGREEGMT